MTVLTKYQRLECPGVWRASDKAQRRNVYVSLGDATLVIKNDNDDALAHWSLPAVTRSNPGTMPAIYKPAPDDEEFLEIDDPDMIDAIATVARALSRGQSRPGRLRRLVLSGVVLGGLGLAGFWLPDALVRHTAKVMPDSVRTDIGQRLLSALEPVTGKVCTARGSQGALAQLKTRLFKDLPFRIMIVPAGPQMATHLPGGVILLRKDLLEEHAGPNVAAGAAMTEAVRNAQIDPMLDFLRHSGPITTFEMLTQGVVEDQDLQRYAELLLTATPDTVAPEVLLTAFANAGLTSTPFARASDPSGETTFPLIEADPFPKGSEPVVLSDPQWLRLQGICER